MFPVVDLEGEFIESKQLIWGFPVVNYLELVAVAGIGLSILDLFFDLFFSANGAFGGILQILEIISYILIFRLKRKTSTWYVLSMLVVGIGIVLRVLLNVLYFGLPALLESHDSFRLRLETNQMFAFFIPSGVSELTEDLVGQIRQKLALSVCRSIMVVVVSCILFVFVERARELAKHLTTKARSPKELEEGKGTSSVFKASLNSFCTNKADSKT